MIKFDKEKVLLLQQLVIESSGGTAGVRDFALLDSAIESAYQTFGGNELYPSKVEKGARLGYNLISNHAFVDGNKRIGLLVMLSFLAINGVNIKYTDEDLIEIGLSLADGKMNYEDLLNWIKTHENDDHL
ncbi:MAG: type II toxin-antitoxin system death-on-curing family toxin [Clostridiales bacterium]|nr:type II toxin-antitoxin system death-on-curing family toxin [Clostridiales bacterium]